MNTQTIKHDHLYGLISIKPFSLSSELSIVIRERIFFILFSCFSIALQAQQYSFDYSGSYAVDHSDNFRLNRANQQSLSGRLLTTTAELGFESETLSSTIGLETKFNRFDREEFDTDDQIIDFNMSGFNERLSYGIQLDGRRESIRLIEIEDSGVVDVGRYESASFAPFLQYSVSEKSRVGLNLNSQKRDYDTEIEDRYFGYDFDSGFVRYTYLPDENSSYYVSYVVRKIEYQERSSQVIIRNVLGVLPVSQTSVSVNDIDGWNIGGNYSFTETLSFNLEIGKENTTQSYEDVQVPFLFCEGLEAASIILLRGINPCVETESEADTADVSLTWNKETYNVSLNYSESLRPSSTGNVADNSIYNFSVDKNFNESQTIIFDYEVSEIKERTFDPSGDFTFSSERTFNVASLRYAHRITEAFAIDLVTIFRKRRQVVLSDSATARSKFFQIKFRYTPRTLVW